MCTCIVGEIPGPTFRVGGMISCCLCWGAVLDSAPSFVVGSYMGWGDGGREKFQAHVLGDCWKERFQATICMHEHASTYTQAST